MRSSRKGGPDHIAAGGNRPKVVEVRNKGACAEAVVALIRFVPGTKGLGIAMANVDRAALIDLLDRLGSDDDAAVLEAARALHRKAAESGLSWDDLIRLDEADEPSADAVPLASPPDADETTRLVDRLLRKDVSDELREDLTEMKRQLADGSLDQEDRRYVRALAKRLGV